MAKKEEPQGVQCENTDIELLRRQLARLEKTLTDNFAEVSNQIGNLNIPMLPMFPPLAEPQQPQPIEVNLPRNLAKSEDIRTLSGMIQTLNGTVSLVMKSMAEMQKAFNAIPVPDVQAITEKAATEAAEKASKNVINELSPKIDNSTRDALLTGVIKAPGITLDDAGSIHNTLRKINKELEIHNQNDKVRKTNRHLLIGLMIFFNLSFLFGWATYELWQQRNELIRIEWLYRAVRTMFKDTAPIEKIEKEIIIGTDEQRESWQTTIVANEKDKQPSPYLRPHDDWKPKPPKQEDSTEDNEDSGSWFDWLYTPTENERAAQEAVRNNPNIPEGAKP
ncbi:hypothetical protein [Bacteroides bouchesdurhonensis]